MEIQLRVILLVAGLLILLIVAIDVYRRRPLRQASVGFTKNNPDNELLSTVVGEETAIHTDYVDTSEILDLKDNFDLEPDLGFDLPTSIDLPHDQSAELIQEIPTNILTLSIMSRAPYGFNGAELLKALNNANMHFGKNDIFHRHENDDGSGVIMFSLTKAVEPGYFYLDALAHEHVPGITMFILPDQLTRPEVAFDKMVRVAKQIAFVLNGELLDHAKQPLTLTTIDRYRTQLRG